MSTEFYSGGGYLEKHPEWHVGEASWKASNILKMISKHNLQPKSVCEIGCGAGEILNRMYSEMPSDVKFSGYEISPQAYELAKTREKDRLTFHINNLESVPGNNTFDLCLMIDVFEHVEDFYGFLRIAKEKGKHFIFHVPLDLSVQSVWRATPLMRKRKNVGHIHYFTKDTSLASLEHAGYKIKDWFYTGSYIDLPTKTLKSKLAKIPRQLLFNINADAGVRILGGYSIMVLAE